MLDRIIDEKWLTAKAVVGLWPANSVGDDIGYLQSANRRPSRRTLHFLRQQVDKPDDRAEFLPGRFRRAARTAASTTGSAHSR